MLATAEKRPDVKELRYIQGDTLKSLAEKIGVTPDAISKWERGMRAVDTRTRMAYAYVYEIDDLDEVDWDAKRTAWLEEQANK